jgi:hypothetical protein
VSETHKRDAMLAQVRGQSACSPGGLRHLCTTRRYVDTKKHYRGSLAALTMRMVFAVRVQHQIVSVTGDNL